MKNILERLKANKIVLITILLSVIGTFLLNQYIVKDYSRVNNETTQFVSAKVVDITENNLKYSEDLDIYLGKQKITVVFLEGDSKDKEVTLDNYLTAAHNIEVSKGSKVIISADEPEQIEGYYTVYSYDQGLGMIVFTVILFAAIILIGGSKGVKAIAGLGYTLYLVIYFLLPLVFSGYPPILLTILVVALSTCVTLLLLNGSSKKTYCAISATVLGVVLSALCFYLMSIVFKINGFSSDEAESLVLINQATGLQIKDVLFASILISSLGAIMDVGMSIISALYELYQHNSQIGREELFKSGIEIGKDMIGTMANTLILAFTGSSFVSLLVLFSYNVNIVQLMNSNFLIIEFAQGIAGTLGIVLTVPIASFIGSYVLKGSYSFITSKFNST